MEKKKNKLNIFDSVFEIIGWIQIAISPIIIGAIIAFFVYSSNKNKAGFIIAVIIFFAGVILGAIWATSVYKKKGTIFFMSRVSASPELDKKEEEKKEEETKKG
jgi:uncharacterized protein YacL